MKILGPTVIIYIGINLLKVFLKHINHTIHLKTLKTLTRICNADLYVLAPDSAIIQHLFSYEEIKVLFIKNFKITWLITPWWPLIPLLLRSCVTLPCIIVSKFQANASKYDETKIEKPYPKGQWPQTTSRWPLTPRPWDHMWLYPSITV